MRSIDYTLKQSKHLISSLQNVASQLHSTDFYDTRRRVDW
jgi:hypothetical protein